MRILRLLALSAVLSIGATAPTPAQVSGGVVFIPPVTANHCAAWNSPNVLKDSGGSCGGSGSPGGSNTQLQYNNSGSFGGISGATTNGTAVTVAPNDLLLTGSSSGTATLNAPATGGGTLTLPPGSVGLVAGPASSVNGHVATFNGTGGNIIQDGGALPTGTVTSVATGAGLTGGTITTSGTISTTEVIRAVTTTSDTILSSDAAKLVTYSNGSAIAVTLPQATGSFAAGFAFSVQNLGAGTVTITPTTSTINGTSTLAVTTNQGCDIVSDGTNWQVSACTAVVPSGGSGTVNSGTAGNGAYYATSTTAVSDGGSVTVNFGGVQVSSGSSAITNGLRLQSANTPGIWANSTNVAKWASTLMTNLVSVVDTNTSGYQLVDGNTSATGPVFVPNRVDFKAGIGADTSGDVSLVADNAGTATEMVRLTGTNVIWEGLTPGTSAKTGYLCYDASKNTFLENVTCVASLEEYKIKAGDISPSEALSIVEELRPFWGTWNQKTHPDSDTAEQPFLGAHQVAGIDKRLAVYDHGKLSGVRYSDGGLVAVYAAAIQEQQKEIDELWIGLLIVGAVAGFGVVRTYRK